jgi:hypothetical protein
MGFFYGDSMKQILPDEHRKYEWIAKEFAQVKGVEVIGHDEGPNHLVLWMTNNMAGKAEKTFSFKLKERVFMEFRGIPDDFLDYDIMDLFEPGVFVNLGLIKAERFFSEKALNQ